jgi:hypothetical protein
MSNFVGDRSGQTHDDEVEVGIEVDEEGSSCCACAMMVLIDYVEVDETNWARSLEVLL